MHDLEVYVEGLPFAWVLSLENSEGFHLCFWLDLLYSMSFFLSISVLIFWQVFDAISSKLDDISSVYPFLKM